MKTIFLRGVKTVFEIVSHFGHHISGNFIRKDRQTRAALLKAWKAFAGFSGPSPDF